jgi:hypothetical protein
MKLLVHNADLREICAVLRLGGDLTPVSLLPDLLAQPAVVFHRLAFTSSH